MQKILDKILLSENVVENFYKYYENSEFRGWLLSVLPEVEDCRTREQDTPWHIYNCLDHILHSVEEMNKLSVSLDSSLRKVLAYVMFFHDIGKPASYIRRYSKLFKREVDSFFDHNKKSVKIADRALPSFDFSEKEQALIKLLVEEHDIFMFMSLSEDGNKYHRVLSNQLVKEYIEKYSRYGDGKKILGYLLLVGRADNLAQNPEMTKESLVKLDVIEEILNGNLNGKDLD